MSEWQKAQAEADWADETEDEDSTLHEVEPTYRDGSVKHECWGNV